ncbi:hypothetical protein [Paraliomyxa miuraensis]|uniref:hypothetical protein n=1 Tax=Paraliomyxa miuraensis TaxID=376150 RepID=UPI00225A9972|nr:hypothetical protein [Paraliomyxa miuraensis]MCX4244773.1 hypothetical protein [Paraliomyxa miuraensis]
MHTRVVFALVGLLGCTKSGPKTVDEVEPSAPPQSVVEPDEPPEGRSDGEPEGTVAAATITVQMTAATLADDCGGGPNTPPREPPMKAKRSKSDAGLSAKSKAKRRCEQSSIQLAIVAPEGARPAAMAVRSVELMLESGTSLGMLEARAPSVWSDADGYLPWDQKVEPGQDLSVSYALTQPDWSKVEDRWNQTYTVKAVLSVDGDDQTVQQSVEVDAPTSLPPNVKT